jgi:hypothetical protein
VKEYGAELVPLMAAKRANPMLTWANIRARGGLTVTQIT